MRAFDPNMEVQTPVLDGRLAWYDAGKAPLCLYGFDGSTPDCLSRRLPEETARGVSEGVLGFSAFAAGGRLRFYTDSKTIAIRASYGSAYHPTSLNACLVHGFDLYTADESGRETYAHTYRPPQNVLDDDVFEAEYHVRREGGAYYTLNFPCYSEVRSLLIGLDEGCVLRSGLPYVNEKPVIFYGSSITHSAAACRPGNSYESFLSQWLNMDYANLGFAGRAMGEEAMARYLAGREMCAFVMDYDHNAPNAEHLQKTHYPFYEIIREKQPGLPIVMISKPDFFMHPETDAVRRDVIRASYEKARSLGDENVYFVDGETFFEGEDYESCTIDGAHPNDIGFHRMAQKLKGLMKTILEQQCGK